MLTAPINEIIVFVVYFIAVFLDIDYQGQGLFPTDLTVRFISYQSYVLEDEIKKLGLALRIKKVWRLFVLHSLQELFFISCHLNLIRRGYTAQTYVDPHVFDAAIWALREPHG